MQIVGHLKCPYLPITQTFVYEQISHLPPETSPVYTNQVINGNAFPLSRLYRFETLDELQGLWREHQVKALHAHFAHNGTYILPLKRKNNLPMVTSFHGADVTSRPRESRNFMANLKQLFQHGELFTVVSKAMVKDVVKLGCPQVKIRILHCGIDLVKFPFQTPIIRKGERIIILSIGRLVEKKGMACLLKAFAILQARNQGCLNLVIIGEGPLEGELKALANTLGVSGEVVFLGAMGHQEVVKQMARAHLFVLASQQASNGDKEGIPVALMEALASGLPVVSTFHQGIPELVQDGVNGFLVPEGDHEALAGTLQKLIEHQEWWPGLGKAGRCQVRQEFNILLQIKKLNLIYEELLSLNKGHSHERG